MDLGTTHRVGLCNAHSVPWLDTRRGKHRTKPLHMLPQLSPGERLIDTCEIAGLSDHLDTTAGMMLGINQWSR